MEEGAVGQVIGAAPLGVAGVADPVVLVAAIRRGGDVGRGALRLVLRYVGHEGAVVLGVVERVEVEVAAVLEIIRARITGGVDHVEVSAVARPRVVNVGGEGAGVEGILHAIAVRVADAQAVEHHEVGAFAVDAGVGGRAGDDVDGAVAGVRYLSQEHGV